MLKRIIALTVIICFGIEQTGYAQVAHMLDVGAASGLSAMERFRPMQLRSLIYDSRAHTFNLVVDKGDKRKARQEEVGEAATRLMEYFRIGVALPDSSFWVNLRPDGADRVIDPVLEKTDLGKVLLAADLALKKDMAKATSPNTALGRKYWNRLYAKAEALFGSREVTIPTLTRPWIVPGEIIVRQSNSSAYVYKAALQVQLEQDHLLNSKTYRFDDPRAQQLNEYSSALIRELILPELAKRVNSSRTYAELRQVYYSLILAQWFKRHFNGSDAEYARLINSSDLAGLNSKTPWSKDTYFEAYRKSFNEGEYNTRESVSKLTGTTMRNYVSGGIVMTGNMQGWTPPLNKNIIYRNEVALDGGTLRPAVIDGAVQLNAESDKEPMDNAVAKSAEDAVPYTSVYSQGPKWSFFRALEVSGYAGIMLGFFAWFSTNVIGIPALSPFVFTLIGVGVAECIAGMTFGGLEPVAEPAQKDGGSYKPGLLIEALKNAIKSGDGIVISGIIHELGRTTSLAALGYLIRLSMATHLQNSALVRRAATLAMNAIEARWVPVLNTYIKDYTPVRVKYIDSKTGDEKSKTAVIMRLVKLDGEDIRVQFYGTAAMLFLSEITDIVPVTAAKDGGMSSLGRLNKADFAQINAWIDEAPGKLRKAERKAFWNDMGALAFGVATYGLLAAGFGGQVWLLMGVPFTFACALILKCFGYDQRRHYPIVPGLGNWIQKELNDYEQLPATWYKMRVHLLKKTREMQDGQVVYGGGDARAIAPEKVAHIEAMIIEYFRILTDRFEKPGSDKTSHMMHKYTQDGQLRFFGGADIDSILWTDGGMNKDTLEQVVTVVGGLGVVALTGAVYSAFGSMAGIGALFAGVIALFVGGKFVVNYLAPKDTIQRDGGAGARDTVEQVVTVVGGLGVVAATTAAYFAFGYLAAIGALCAGVVALAVGGTYVVNYFAPKDTIQRDGGSYEGGFHYMRWLVGYGMAGLAGVIGGLLIHNPVLVNGSAALFGVILSAVTMSADVHAVKRARIFRENPMLSLDGYVQDWDTPVFDNIVSNVVLAILGQAMILALLGPGGPVFQSGVESGFWFNMGLIVGSILGGVMLYRKASTSITETYDFNNRRDGGTTNTVPVVSSTAKGKVEQVVTVVGGLGVVAAAWAVDSAFGSMAGIGVLFAGVIALAVGGTFIVDYFTPADKIQRDGGVERITTALTHRKVYAELARIDAVYQRELKGPTAKEDVSLTLKHSKVIEDIKAAVKASIKSWDRYYDFHSYLADRVHSVKQFSIPVVLGLAGLLSLANLWFAVPLLAGAGVSAYVMHARREQAKRIYASVNLIGPNFDLAKRDGGDVRDVADILLEKNPPMERAALVAGMKATGVLSSADEAQVYRVLREKRLVEKNNSAAVMFLATAVIVATVIVFPLMVTFSHIPVIGKAVAMTAPWFLPGFFAIILVPSAIAVYYDGKADYVAGVIDDTVNVSSGVNQRNSVRALITGIKESAAKLEQLRKGPEDIQTPAMIVAIEEQMGVKVSMLRNSSLFQAEPAVQQEAVEDEDVLVSRTADAGHPFLTVRGKMAQRLFFDISGEGEATGFEGHDFVSLKSLSASIEAQAYLDALAMMVLKGITEKNALEKLARKYGFSAGRVDAFADTLAPQNFTVLPPGIMFGYLKEVKGALKVTAAALREDKDRIVLHDGGRANFVFTQKKVSLTPAEHLWLVKRSALQMVVNTAMFVPIAFASAAIVSGAWVLYAGAAFGTWLTLTVGLGLGVSMVDFIREFVKSYRVNRKQAVEFKEMLAKFDGGTLAEQWLDAIWDWNLTEKPRDADFNIGEAAKAISLTPEFAAQKVKTGDEILPERIYISTSKIGANGLPFVVRGSDIIGHDSRTDGTEIVDWKGHEAYVAGLGLRDPIQVLQARGELETIWRSDTNFDGGFMERFKFVRSRMADDYIRLLSEYNTPLTQSEKIAEKLGMLGESKAIEPLKRYLADVVLGDDYDVYPAAEAALRRFGLTDNDFEQLYLSAFRNPTNHRLVRKNAVKVLGERAGGINAYTLLTNTSEEDVVVKWAIDQAINDIMPRLSEESLRLRALLNGDDVRDDRGIRAALIKLTDLCVFFIEQGDFALADAIVDDLGKRFAQGVTVTMYGPGYAGDGDKLWSFKRIAAAAAKAGQGKYIERMIDILGPKAEMDEAGISRGCDRVVQVLSAAPLEILGDAATEQGAQLRRKIFGLVDAGCDHECLLVSHLIDARLLKISFGENEKLSTAAWSWIRLKGDKSMRIMATRALGHLVADRLEKGYPVHPAYVLDALRETLAKLPESDRAYYVQEGILPALREMVTGFFKGDPRDDKIFLRKAVALAVECREYSFDTAVKDYTKTQGYIRSNWLLITFARGLVEHQGAFQALLDAKKGTDNDLMGAYSALVKPLSEELKGNELEWNRWDIFRDDSADAVALSRMLTLNQLREIVEADAALYRVINTHLDGAHWRALCSDAVYYLNKYSSARGATVYDWSNGDVGVKRLAEYLVFMAKTIADADTEPKIHGLRDALTHFSSTAPVYPRGSEKPAGQVIVPDIFMRTLIADVQAHAAAPGVVPIARDGGRVKLKNGAEADAALVERVMAQVRILYFERDLVLMELVAKINDPDHVFYGDRGAELIQRGLVEADGTVSEAVRNIVLSGVVGEHLFMRLVSPLAGEQTGRYDGGVSAGKIAMGRLALAIQKGNGRLAGFIAQALGKMGYAPAVGLLTALEADTTFPSYGWFARNEAKMALFEIKYRLVEANLKQFNANAEWQARYRDSARSVFGVTNEYGTLLHLTASADLADGLVSQGVEGLYKFSVERGVVSLDSALTENRGFVELVLQQTFKAVEVPAESVKKDGGVIPGDMGGIDMRSLPAVTVAARPLMASAPATAGISLKDLERQWSDIRVEMAKGGKPYLKMRSYVANCSSRPDTSKQLHAVNAYVADILKHEEEEAEVTCAELKEIILQLS